jgi:23S rRNA (cytosine1962-C5)-methyltransferase
VRALKLAKTGLNKVRAYQKELKQADIEDSLKSIPPGEWCLLIHSSVPIQYLCFVNPMVDDKYVSVHVLDQFSEKDTSEISPEEFIQAKLAQAVERRLQFRGYEQTSRLFYGWADGLPGLIADQFQDKIILQINTSGIDRFRELIKQTLEKITESKVYFLDNQKYREKEFLPVFETDQLPDISIVENGLSFHLRSEVMQKVGFYYDHRENRYQLISILSRLNRKFDSAVDLFCYAGAWGLAALKGGAANCSFVDQGDFETEINQALSLNGFAGKGSFRRSDVFKYLDESINVKRNFDLILCDPPAFAKSFSQKDQALEGYSKLHRKVLKAAAPKGLIAFSSCTHYVNHEEFQKNILEAAHKENRRLQLIYSGMQGWDHPVPSLMDKANYIKSYFYLLEN